MLKNIVDNINIVILQRMQNIYLSSGESRDRFEKSSLYGLSPRGVRLVLLPTLSLSPSDEPEGALKLG